MYPLQQSLSVCASFLRTAGASSSRALRKLVNFLPAFSFLRRVFPIFSFWVKKKFLIFRSVQNLLTSSLLSKNVKISGCRNIILRVVLCGYETWSVTLREERRLRVFENRVLRRIFGPKRDEVTGEWRKLHNEDLNYLYCSRNIVRVIKSRSRWAGHVGRMERGEVYTGLWWGNLRERDHLEVLGIDGRII